MTDPSPQTIAVLAILYSRHGDALVTRGDVESAIRALPGAGRIAKSQLDEALRSVAPWLRAAAGNAYVLGDDAHTLLAFPAEDDEVTLSPEEDAQLVELLRGNAASGAIDRDALTAVTRRFLAEVLAGADIPDELLEAVVEAYVQRGTLTMSEDGGRYTISL
ncbi:MAG: hypothetical protein QOI24_2566 [Acidobacteriota bacterium]|jgi:hypothetical protein|nr:hypothetical protein [Acidobacteriota bacterium]